MAGLSAILKALWRATRRDFRSFQSIAVNNFFIFAAVLAYGAVNSGLEPQSAEPFLIVIGFLLLFPLSSDPLSRIPADRLALWPLSKSQRAGLRLVSFAFSPVTWLAILLLLKTAQLFAVLLLLALATAFQIILSTARFATRRQPQFNPLRHVPQLPGRFGGMLRNNTRNTFLVLDTYIAILVSAAGTAYRFLVPHPDAAAFPILALLVALALSTYGQSMFGLELRSGLTRYRLLPVRGWQILLAKDIVFLAIVFILTLPFSVASGFTFALVALAIGHHSSVHMRLPQQRWRFTGGKLLPIGLLQLILGISLTMTEREKGPVLLLPVTAVYLASLFFYGWEWDRQVLRAAHSSR